jgi:hypothetical protein
MLLLTTDAILNSSCSQPINEERVINGEDHTSRNDTGIVIVKCHNEKNNVTKSLVNV